MTCLKKAGKESQFPLFTAIYKIAFEGSRPSSILEIN